MSAAAIPAIPAGTNPFTVYGEVLHVNFYPTPSNGFEVRLSILFALLALGFISAWVFLFVYAVDARRRGQGFNFWLARLVQRPSGKYIVLNTKVVSAIMTVINTVLQIAYIADIWHVYLKGGGQWGATAWRTLPCIGLLLHGWMVSWGLLQAYLLAPDQKTADILSATVANTLFIGGAVVMIGGIIGTGVTAILAGHVLWNKYIALDARLKTLEASWNGTTDFTQVLGLAPALTEVNQAALKWTHWESVLYGIVAAMTLLIVLVNMGSVGLTRILRRQINFKVEQLQNFTAAEASISNRIQSSGNGRRTTFDMSHDPMSSVLTTSRPTRKEIRGLASAAGPSGHQAEHAKGIQALQKAESDLILISSCVAIIALAATSTLLFISIYCNSTSAINIPWPVLEYMFTSVLWAWIVATLIFTVAVTCNSWVNMPADRLNNDIDTIHMGTAATGTLRGFFNLATLRGSRDEGEQMFPTQQIQVQVETIEVEDSYRDAPSKESL